jgi:hypothetical protein
MTDNAPMTPAALRTAGEALFGAEWHRALALALGPLHPRGPRESINDRLFHRWAKGERPVPAWVPEVLPVIAQEVLVVEEGRIAQVREVAAGRLPLA